MTMDINSMLYRLCSVDGVSGDERNASEIALSMLESYTDDCSIDDFGNVIGHIKVRATDVNFCLTHISTGWDLSYRLLTVTAL